MLGDVMDLKEGSEEERIRKTLEAMRSGVSFIYQGVIRSDGLLGIPDLLQRNSDGTYLPVDIKSGMGVEGGAMKKVGTRVNIKNIMLSSWHFMLKFL